MIFLIGLCEPVNCAKRRESTVFWNKREAVLTPLVPPALGTHHATVTKSAWTHADLSQALIVLHSLRFIIPHRRPALTATILDGNKIRDEIQSELIQQIAELKRVGVTPGLAAVLVGENPASQIYVRSKVKTCEALGLFSEKVERSKDSSTDDLLHLVNDLNHNDAIDGILIQLPLPPQVDTKRVLTAVDPAKDVDGFHPMNVGNLVAGRTGFVPCTPAGIMEILKRSKIPLKGARAVVVGRSDIVGKPVAMLLLHEHASVTICHSRTRDLPAVARQADILVAAIGKAALVTADFIKPGATVIDVGINRLTTEEEVRKIFHDPTGPLATLLKRGSVLVGDVQPEDARAVAGAFTPVPGGVGPLTIVMLMANTIQAARLRRGMKSRS